MTEIPRCQHFGSCGGCKTQDLNYNVQLEEKELAIRNLFSAVTAPDLCDNIVGCDLPWRYRNKMEFSFSQDKKGQRFLGLIMTASRGRVVTLNECHLTPSWYTEILSRVYQWWTERDLQAYYPAKDQGSLRTLTVRGNFSKMVILTVSGHPDYALSEDDIESFKHIAAIDEKTSLYITVHQAKKKHLTTFLDQHLAGPDLLVEPMHIQGREYLFALSPRAFFQPNIKMAEKMYADIVTFLALHGDEQVLDLYCGIGSIGLIIAAHAGEVIGVELNDSAVKDAQHNIKLNQIKNMQVFQGDVGQFLTERGGEFSPDVVIVDPPRAGLDAQTVAFLNVTLPKTILYVSCNPTSQAQNIAELPQYRITKVVPYDQFPHTRHVENIVLLTRLISPV